MPLQTFRLFLSSPSDAKLERQRAAQIIERLNVTFAGRARIEPVLWEEAAYSAHTGFQEQIPQAAACDVVVAIFRARLGTPLPPSFPIEPTTQTPYPSGTAYEVLTAIQARKVHGHLPDIFVFRHPDAPAPPLDAPDRAEIEAQWESLKRFFDTWFRTQTGEFLAAFQDYGTVDDFAEQMDMALRQFLARHGMTAEGPRWNRALLGSPFPGLVPFGADRGTVFFGRELAIGQGIARLREAETMPGRVPFLLVLGASGAGKSSLLRAGLLPRLVLPGTVPEIDLWRVVLLTPGQDPFTGLAAQLLTEAALGVELRAGAFQTPEILARQLAISSDLALVPLRSALSQATATTQSRGGFDRPRPARLLLAIDQAERLFTETDPDQVAPFAELLAKLVTDGLATVIMVMRSDAYAWFQSIPSLLALRQDGATLDLVPPASAELEQMIIWPALACDPPLAFETSSQGSLAARLVADAEGGDALPLLQTTLARLSAAESVRGDGVLRFVDYRGLAQAVTDTADAALAGLPVASRAALPALVAGLVSDVMIDPNQKRLTPVVTALDRTVFLARHPERAALLEAFVGHRLLVSDGDGSGARVRPAHEALLRIWPEAVALVAELGPLLRVRRALQPLVRDWTEAPEVDKARHLEISPALLEGALTLVARIDVEQAMREFVSACEAAAAARARLEAAVRDRALRDARAIAIGQRRLARRTGAGLLMALALAGLATWLGWQARIQQDRAERSVAMATDAANGLVYGLARKFRDAQGVPVAVTHDILDQARNLQTKLLDQGVPSDALRRSEGVALIELVTTRLDAGQTKEAFAEAQQACDLLKSLVATHPDSSDFQMLLSQSLRALGNVQVAQGNLAGALESYQSSLDIVVHLTQADPGSAEGQSDLWANLIDIGDAQTSRGLLLGALASYQSGQAIADRLVKADAGNTGWQRNLSVSLERIGDAQTAQGNLAGALLSYQSSFDIINRLATSDPGNTGLQRNLSASFMKLGNAQTDQGNLPGAFSSYRASLDIRDRLAKSDPGNAGWQRDLSMSLNGIGDVQAAQGNLSEALVSYQSSLNIYDRLTNSDPENVEWRRRLSVTLSRIGHVQTAQNDLQGALASYLKSFDIFDRLAKNDPGNAGSQRDLALSLQKLGDAESDLGDRRAAMRFYRSDLTIAKGLAESDPGNAVWQGDLSGVLDRIGNVQMALGQLTRALESYRLSFDISDRLAKGNPENAIWERNLGLSYAHLAHAYRRSGKIADARTAASAGREIMAAVVKRSPDQPQWKDNLAWFDAELLALEEER